MTEFSWEERHKYCDELSNFIDDTENYVKEVCSSLGWSLDSIKDDESYLTCPFNEGHRVPERTIQKHLEKCEWNTLGYTKDCKPLPEPTLPSQSPSTIKFDVELQHRILQEAKQKNPELNIGNDERLIPQTSDRLTSDFTSDERKTMYEYVIAHTVAPDIGQHDITDINKPEKSEVASTPIVELLAQERNLKRRRAKHRGVHTNKKSQTEILREVIVQQMEMYKEYLSEKLGIPIADLNDENNFNSQCIDNIKREKSVDEVDQYRDYKNISERNSKYYDKDYYSSSRRHTNQDTWDSHKNQDKYESRKCDKNGLSEKKCHDSDYYSRKHGGSGSRDRKRNDHSSSHERKRDDYESRNTKRDRSDPRDGKRNDCQSRDRKRDDSNSREKKRDDSDTSNRKRKENLDNDAHPEYDNSHDHKHYVTKASEKPFDSKSEEYYKERKTHEKRKKDSKKRKDHKRDRSRDSDDDRKRKVSKHKKRDKHRSRSRS